MKLLHTLFAISLLIVLIASDNRSQAPQQRASSDKPPVIERSITLGDYRFHYIDRGKGSPTVVMDAGLCQPMNTWDKVTGEVATFTRVFTYDRAGLGSSSRVMPPDAKQSARPPEMRTSRRITRELRDLLRNAGAPAPYVLVGHSFGGLNVRLYASEHPDEVAGVVLIDSSNEGEYSRYASLMAPEKLGSYLRTNRGANCEFINLEASAAELRESAPLPRVPFIVITPTPRLLQLETSQAHLELQADLARRSPSSVHLFAERSGHFIQRDRPEVVVKAIRDVVERVRPIPIPYPTEEDLNQTRILHLSIPSEAAISGAALALSGLAGWQWRKRKRRGKAQMNRAQRRQSLREEKDRRRGSGE